MNSYIGTSLKFVIRALAAALKLVLVVAIVAACQDILFGGLCALVTVTFSNQGMNMVLHSGEAIEAWSSVLDSTQLLCMMMTLMSTAVAIYKVFNAHDRIGRGCALVCSIVLPSGFFVGWGLIVGVRLVVTGDAWPLNGLLEWLGRLIIPLGLWAVVGTARVLSKNWKEDSQALEMTSQHGDHPPLDGGNRQNRAAAQVIALRRHRH